MSLSLSGQLKELQDDQDRTEDKIRIYYNGEIRRESLTLSGEKGWCTEASSIPGAAILTTREFPPQGFLRVDSMRRAVALRDRIQTEVLLLKGRGPTSNSPSYEQL